MAPNGSPGEDGRVLSPDELDLADRDEVTELSDGRFVVSADGSPPSVSDLETETEAEESTPPEVDAELTEATVKEWYEQQLTRSPTEFGYYISLKADDEIRHHTVHSDDITTAFNSLLLWYATTVDHEMPPGAVLGILLSETDTPVQYPVQSFEEFILSQGLSTDDTIGELLAQLRAQHGAVFPPD